MSGVHDDLVTLRRAGWLSPDESAALDRVEAEIARLRVDTPATTAERRLAAVVAEANADLSMAIPCDCDPDDGAICLAHRVLAAAGPDTPADPPCPGCGMTAQVEPSRSEPGRWMCHGCARTFDTPADSQEDKT